MTAGPVRVAGPRPADTRQPYLGLSAEMPAKPPSAVRNFIAKILLAADTAVGWHRHPDDCPASLSRPEANTL
jgi:hypothetical protein